MWSNFQFKKLNTRWEPELAANRAESENQAELLPGTDGDQKLKLNSYLCTKFFDEFCLKF